MLLSCRRIFCSPMFMRKGYLNRSTGVKGKHRPDLSLSSFPAARQADHSATKPESRFLWIFLAGMTVRQPFVRQKIKKDGTANPVRRLGNRLEGPSQSHGGKPGLCGTDEPAAQRRPARANQAAKHPIWVSFLKASHESSERGLGSRVVDTFNRALERSALRSTLCGSALFGPHVTRIGPIGRRQGVSRRDHGDSTPEATIEVR